MSKKHSIVFTQNNCPECLIAKKRLLEAGFSVEERVVGVNVSKQELLAIFPNARTVPQVIINDVPVGNAIQVREYLLTL